MYEYIKGTITSIKPKYIVVEANGIGFLVTVGNPFEFILNSIQTVYIYQQVKEDSLDLFGFKTSDDKEAFLLLLSVKGIGPKSAIAALAGGNPNDLYSAINRGDSKYLTSFPGIGPKAAQQIIFDLQGKITTEKLSNHNPNVAEASEALMALGYTKKDITTVMSNVDMNLGVSELIREALKLLSRN